MRKLQYVRLNYYKYSLRAKAKRPLAVAVAYFDENGKPQDKQLYDFEARVFCHEFDHLQGIPFVHWRVSEGDIEIISKESFENLQFTIEYYKNRLRDTKRSKPDVFEFFDIPLLNLDQDALIEEKMMVDYEMKNKKKISYEEVMLIDIEKGIKKDLKLKLKRETQRQSEEI